MSRIEGIGQSAQQFVEWQGEGVSAQGAYSNAANLKQTGVTTACERGSTRKMGEVRGRLAWRY